MNPIATELNNNIKEQAPAIFDMLSHLGQEIFMPKGILTQGAQAKEKAHKFNATIGIATENGAPMYLDCVYDNLKAFQPEDLFPYAPSTGKLALRNAWQEKMQKENPSLKGKQLGKPIVTNALTHGLSIVAGMFCDEGDYIVMPDKFWGNYRLTFSTLHSGVISTFPTFTNDNKFNAQGLIDKVAECGKLKSKVIVLLNFPNNPTGYTVNLEEAKKIATGLKELADGGIKIVAIVDDAYFGMVYEDSIKESFFCMLAGQSKNLLAIKLDGATKEAFVWGFRVGFITFAATSANDESKALAALEQKVAGHIRATISNCPHPSQTAILKAITSPEYDAQHAAKVEILKKRAVKAKQVLANTKFQDEFLVYPFNSGYFLCLKLLNVDAEKLRVHLLDSHGVGTIATSSTDLRLAFSTLDENGIAELFDIIYKGCKELV